MTWKLNPDLPNNTSIPASLKVERSQLRMLKTLLVATYAAVLVTVQFWMPSSPWVLMPLQTYWQKFRTLRLVNNNAPSKCSLIYCVQLKLRKSYQMFSCTIVIWQRGYYTIQYKFIKENRSDKGMTFSLT